MSSVYPGGTDSFTNPTGANTLNSPDHAGQHTNINDSMVAVQATLGSNAGTSVLKNFAAGNFPARINASNVLQQNLQGTINNSTLGTPAITGGTIASSVYNNGVFGTPAITGGTANNSVFGTPAIVGGTINNTAIGTIAARVYIGTAQSINNATATKVTFNNKDYDIGTNFDATTNYRFVAPVAGYYSFNYLATFASPTTGHRMILYVYLNGVQQWISQWTTSTGGDASGVISDCPKLAANDYLEFYVFQDTGGGVNLNAGKYASYINIKWDSA